MTVSSLFSLDKGSIPRKNARVMLLIQSCFKRLYRQTSTFVVCQVCKHITMKLFIFAGMSVRLCISLICSPILLYYVLMSSQYTQLDIEIKHQNLPSNRSLDGYLYFPFNQDKAIINLVPFVITFENNEMSFGHSKLCSYRCLPTDLYVQSKQYAPPSSNRGGVGC